MLQEVILAAQRVRSAQLYKAFPLDGNVLQTHAAVQIDHHPQMMMWSVLCSFGIKDSTLIAWQCA